MKDVKKEVPRILSAVDLTHLQPNERIKIIGNNNLRNRREFLEKLLKAGIAVGLPAILFSGCEPEIIYMPTDEEDCPTYTPSGDNPCVCNTDSLAGVMPKVINNVPAKDSLFINDTAGIEIRIDINKALDITSLTGAVSISPQPTGGFDVHLYDLSNNNTACKTSLALFQAGTSNKLVLLDDTTYTVTLKGTVKDINGKFLDGNFDGTGGDDFAFSFQTVKKYDSCICQSDFDTCPSDRLCTGDILCPTDLPCLSHITCSCQNKSCSCVGNVCFYCDCQFLGCTYNF